MAWYQAQGFEFTSQHEHELQEVEFKSKNGPGMILHDFDVLLSYIIERKMRVTGMLQLPLKTLPEINERLAGTLDGSLPKGENWHQALLVQVSNEVTGIRPAVISKQTLKRLDEYRGFRHVVRNVYTFHFDEAKLEKLVIGAGDVFAQVRVEILAFADFLDAQE